MNIRVARQVNQVLEEALIVFRLVADPSELLGV
jgi:hypothetical protein